MFISMSASVSVQVLDLMECALARLEGKHLATQSFPSRRSRLRDCTVQSWMGGDWVIPEIQGSHTVR